MLQTLYQTGFEDDAHGFSVDQWVIDTAQAHSGSRSLFASGYGTSMKSTVQTFELEHDAEPKFWWRQSGPYTGIQVRVNGTTVYDRNYNQQVLNTWIEDTRALTAGTNTIEFRADYDADNALSDGTWIDDISITADVPETGGEEFAPLGVFVHRGDSIGFQPDLDHAAGSVVVLESLVGITARPVAADQPGSLQLRGVFDIVKDPSAAIATGAPIYWDAVGGRVSTTASGNVFVGKSVAAAASGEPTIRVRLSQ